MFAEGYGVMSLSVPPVDRQAHALAALSVTDAEARLKLDWDSPLRHATFFKAVFRPAVLRANRLTPSAVLPTGTHPHAPRHTYASLCVAAGIPMCEVSRFMGYAKPSTTETVYAHLLREDQRRDGGARRYGRPRRPDRERDPAAALVRLRYYASLKCIVHPSPLPS